MSIHVAAAVYRVKLGSSTRKAVALKLADCSNDDGGSIFMSVGRIAREVEVSDRTVQRTLEAFIAEGLLVVEKIGGKGPCSTTHYRFDLEKLAALPSTNPVKGDTVSPLTKTSRVTSTTAKGDTGDKKGDTVSPNPSIPFSEPSRKSRPKAGEAKQDLVGRAVEAYNSAAAQHKFSICNTVSRTRRRKLEARIEDIGGIGNFETALRAIPHDDWMMGRIRKPGKEDRPFKLDIDYLLQTEGKSGDVLAKLFDKAVERDRARAEAFTNEYFGACIRHLLGGHEWLAPEWREPFPAPWPDGKPMTMDQARSSLRSHSIWTGLLARYESGDIGAESEFKRIRCEMFEAGERERLVAAHDKAVERHRMALEAARPEHEARQRELQKKAEQDKSSRRASLIRQIKRQDEKLQTLQPHDWHFRCVSVEKSRLQEELNSIGA